MVLVVCHECEKTVSSEAMACPNCGAPVSTAETQPRINASRVHFDKTTGLFSGTVASVTSLALRAVQQIGWKIDNVNEQIGLVTFQTGISWGSWSGVSCSLVIEEQAPGLFRVTGKGKQNVSGLQLVAIDFGGEANKRAQRAIDMMEKLAEQ